MYDKMIQRQGTLKCNGKEGPWVGTEIKDFDGKNIKSNYCSVFFYIWIYCLR